MDSNQLYIKSIKPKKNSKYRQGVINPRSCIKCKQTGDNPIIYRSGLELQFINYVECNSSIVAWASEPMEIKYVCRLDKREHRYYPDYIIENKNGTKYIVEIKPYNQTKQPKSTDSLWLKEQWVKNCDKWKAAKTYADKHNMKFIVVTEKFFN